MKGDKGCFLCGSCDNSVKCGECDDDVFYCKEHLKFHKLGVEGRCSPFCVVEVEGAGRGLVATRDINKGEHILTTVPAATGPCARTPPQCVNCYVLVSPSSSLVCPKCSLLVCSAQCSTGSDHQVECSILSNIRTKLRKKNRDGDKIWRDCLPSITASVTTIRLLSLKWRDPPAWSVFTNLMSHQFNEQVWKIIQHAFHNILHLDPRIEEQDLKLVFGIQSTNGALLHFPPGYGRALGVFPIQAFLNHSCMCNTNTKDFLGENKVEIHARFPIKKGEELTTSYLQPTQATLARRQFLFHTWNFWCSCNRCSDPSEGGANLAGLVCTPSCPGIVLPTAPLDSESDWSCSECRMVRSNMQVQEILQMALMVINSFPKENIRSEELEEIIFRLETLLSQTNWLMMEIKQKLLNVYMQAKMVDRPTKERKVQLSESILQYMDSMDPGNEDSPRKQILRKCQIETNLEILTEDYKSGKVEKKRLAKALADKQLLMHTREKHTG